MQWGKIIEELLKDFDQWRNRSGYPNTNYMMLQFLEAEGYLKDRKLATKYFEEGRDEFTFPPRTYPLLEGCLPSKTIITPKNRRKKKQMDPFLEHELLENAKCMLSGRKMEFRRYKELPTVVSDVGVDPPVWRVNQDDEN